METKSIDGLTLFYPAEEREAAGIIGDACFRSLEVIRDLWGLETPKDCRVYVMDSWKRFLFHSAPWPWRILLAGTMLFWMPRVKKIWRYAGGWAQRYGSRRAIGVKPPRLIEAAEGHMGRRIFVPRADTHEKIRQIACHELTHAFTAHLKLPAWLNEGLALVTVDRMMGKPTIQSETLRALDTPPRTGIPKGYRRLRRENEDGLVYHYVRAYWLTRYLMETEREALRDLLGRRCGRQAFELKLASRLAMNREEFWTKIDRLTVSHFEPGL
jgi:hypothetical protein